MIVRILTEYQLLLLTNTVPSASSCSLVPNQKTDKTERGEEVCQALTTAPWLSHIGWHPQTQCQLDNHVCHSLATKASGTSVDFLKVPGASRKDSNLNMTPEHLTTGQGKWPDFHPWTTDLRFLSGSLLHFQNVAVYVVSGDGTGYSVPCSKCSDFKGEQCGGSPFPSLGTCYKHNMTSEKAPLGASA